MPPKKVPTTADHFDGMKADYQGARASRFRRKRTGIATNGSGADYHYRNDSDYLRLMEYARDMDRNDVIVGQTINRAVDNMLQDGLKVDPQTGNTKLDDLLYQRWLDWSCEPSECDVTGEMAFSELETLVARQRAVDGDVFILPTATGHIQIVEAHRCRSPQGRSKKIVLGIVLDELRKRKAYYFTKDDIDPMSAVKMDDIEKYDAYGEDGSKQVFHYFVRKRVSQTRGVTDLAPIFDVCGMFEDIQFAKLVQQQVVSCFAILRQRNLQYQGGDAPQQGPRVTEVQSDGTNRQIEGIAPGMQIAAQPGETLEGFSPAVPNAEFFDHVRLILTLVGINLGLPLVMTLMDASETNFSGFRGAVDQARLGFRRNQNAMVSRFHKPVYTWKVQQWLEQDPGLKKLATSSRKVRPLNHCWKLPRWPYIEPLKDAGADLLRMRNGLASPRQVHAERGGDWFRNTDESVEDNAYAIDLAKAKAAEINAKYPDDPDKAHWRELISLPTPDGVTVALAAEQPPQEQTQPKGGKNGKRA